MKKYAIIVAAGSGSRMGTTVPKQFLLLAGKPVLLYSINVFLEAFEDLQIILVLPKDYMETGKAISQSAIDPNRIQITPGGETRFQSVKNGIDHISQPSIVFVHDGVRCLLTDKLIHRCFEMAKEKGNAVPAVTSKDSIRIENKNGSEALDRTKVKIIQTPQTFRSDILQAAFNTDYRENFTDEAGVVENYGIKINLVEGEETNIKITHAFDLLVAEKILQGAKL